jgi:hypothetical protein
MIYNIIFADILYYCGIWSYSPVIGTLNLVICYNHWTVYVMLHSGNCGAAVTSTNEVFVGIVCNK